MKYPKYTKSLSKLRKEEMLMLELSKLRNIKMCQKCGKALLL